MRPTLLLTTLLLTATARPQWQIQQSHTTADLRGIHSLLNGVAWASGTNGTVLHTGDSGQTWQLCAVPPGAEHLDFRGIQAFNAQTAIVMSSGKGDLSRLYKTTDACQTWKLVFTNPDKEGFWDAIQFDIKPWSKSYAAHSPGFGVILGDPVDQHFAIFLTYDRGDHWERQIRESPLAEAQGEAIFAASNSSLLIQGLDQRRFVTGGPGGPRLLWFWVGEDDTNAPVLDSLQVVHGGTPFHSVSRGWRMDKLPSEHPSESSGAFSLASNLLNAEVIVGGDFSKPADRVDTAWYQGGTRAWHPSITPPHGYRSAVAYSPTSNSWITVGPNGTDLSTDDGRNWHALRPSPAEAPDSDRNWNALSLPFVVGPHGRIGLIRPSALTTP